MQVDLQILQDDRNKFYNNSLLGYRNINSSRNNVTDLKLIFEDLALDYFVLSETESDESFPTAQFTLEGHEIRSRKDRDKYGGGLIEFVNGFICKTMPEYTSDKIECICSEFTISKSKWICFSIYRPPLSSNLTIFFEELTKVLSKAIRKYENIILLGDFNIDFKNKGGGFDKLSEIYDTSNLTNLIKSETFYIKNHKSLIDLFFPNKPVSF